LPFTVCERSVRPPTSPSARINTLQGALTFKGPGIEVSQDKTWVDPIAGLTLRTPDRRVQARVYSEIGGFGVGSDFT
jgi:hypothetical protein